MRSALISMLFFLCVATIARWSFLERPDSLEDSLTQAKSRRQPGPFPSDWFMLQRTWPDPSISLEHFRDAQQQFLRSRSLSSLDEQPHWIPVGPDNVGGRITDLVGHPANNNILYVAAASGGIFKTTDDGQHWTPIFDAAPGVSMGAIAMDPANPDVLFAGTGEANSAGYSYFGTGIYKSTNGGLSWTSSGLENSRFIARIIVEPEDSQRIWVAAMGELFGVGAERGIYLSTDGGATWEQKLFVDDTTGACDVVINPLNPQIIYAAMWSRIRGPDFRQAGGRGSGIFKSTDAGETWMRITDGLPAQADDVGRIGLAISQSNPQILYAIYADHPGFFAGVYRSGDGGESWTRTNDDALSDMYRSFGWYFGNIRVRPDDEDVVFVLGVEMFRTSNGGTTWFEVGNDMHVDHHAMWFRPSSPFQSLVGNDGGLYSSFDNGNSWEFLPGLPINQFYAATVDDQNPERRYGGTQDNGTQRTLTGNTGDWDRIFGGDGFYVNVDPVESNVVYAEYQFGILGRSMNGGEDWSLILSGIDEDERTNWSTPVILDPNNRFTLFYGAERLYRSLNRGSEWTAISPNLTDGGGSGNLSFGTITTIGVSPLNSNIIYAGTDDANFWATIDGGLTWQNYSEGLPDRWITRVVPSPHDSAAVFVTVSGFQNGEEDAHLFLSTNHGDVWTNISGDLPAGPLNDVKPDPDFPGRLYVASDFGAYASSNYGESWQPLGQDLPAVPVIQFVLHQPTRELLAATYGRSMFTLALDSLELNRPPVIVSASPAPLDTIFIPRTITFEITANDPDEDSLAYQWFRNQTSVGTETTLEVGFTEVARESLEVRVSDGELTTSHEWIFDAVLNDAAGETAANPSSHLLLAVYPNPFNPRTTIHFSVPAPGPVTISVHDLQGRLVERLLEADVPAGDARLNWSAADFASGTYFVSLRSANHVQIRKVLLLK